MSYRVAILLLLFFLHDFFLYLFIDSFIYLFNHSSIHFIFIHLFIHLFNSQTAGRSFHGQAAHRISIDERSARSNQNKERTEEVRGVMCSAILYCTVLYCTVLYCTVLYCAVLYCVVLCHDVLCCVEQNTGSDIDMSQHSTVQQNFFNQHI